MIGLDRFIRDVKDVLRRDIGSNPEQLAIVSSDFERCLKVVAGPGSGKTTVIVLRLLKMIYVDDVAPPEIIATTFTRKAAAELKSRILEWGRRLQLHYAKDPDGKWIMAYTCTTAFMTDLDNVEKAPTTWAELLEGDYKVWIGDVEKAAQAYVGVLACAVAYGGDETNLEPAMDFFAELAKQGRLITSNPYVENIEKGEVGVAVVWDFNALGYAETIYESQGEDNGRFAITIPQDGAAASGYANIINKYANNPYAAMLAREIMLSDVGQEFLALGHAKPIRTDVNFSEEAKAAILDNSMYENVYQVKDWAVFDATVAALPELWAENVAIYMN